MSVVLRCEQGKISKNVSVFDNTNTASFHLRVDSQPTQTSTNMKCNWKIWIQYKSRECIDLQTDYNCCYGDHKILVEIASVLTDKYD